MLARQQLANHQASLRNVHQTEINEKQPAKPVHGAHYSLLARVKTSMCVEKEEASRHLHRMAQELAKMHLALI